MNTKDWDAGNDAGLLHARKVCIKLVLMGSNEPMQTQTLEALQRDRLRIAKLIASKDETLMRLVDSYTMASEENKA